MSSIRRSTSYSPANWPRAPSDAADDHEPGAGERRVPEPARRERRPAAPPGRYDVAGALRRRPRRVPSAPASSRSRSAVASVVGEGVQLEPVVPSVPTVPGADADGAQPEHPVHDGRGQVDGPDPVERRRQPLPVEEAALQLDPAVRDPVARRQVAHDTDGDRDRRARRCPRRHRRPLGGAEEEHAEQAGRRTGAARSPGGPAASGRVAAVCQARSRGVPAGFLRPQGELVDQGERLRAVEPVDPQRARRPTRSSRSGSPARTAGPAGPVRSRRSARGTSARSGARAPTSPAACRRPCR